MTESQNIEFWLSMADALMVLALVIFVVGFGFGFITGPWMVARVRARREACRRKKEQRQLEEARKFAPLFAFNDQFPPTNG